MAKSKTTSIVFEHGYKMGIQSAHEWSRIIIDDNGKVNHSDNPIPEFNEPILFKTIGEYPFYFTGYFYNNEPIVKTSRDIAFWRYIEHS